MADSLHFWWCFSADVVLIFNILVLYLIQLYRYRCIGYNCTSGCIVFCDDALELATAVLRRSLYAWSGSHDAVQITAKQCKLVKISANQCKSLQISVNHCKSLQINLLHYISFESMHFIALYQCTALYCISMRWIVLYITAIYDSCTETKPLCAWSGSHMLPGLYHTFRMYRLPCNPVNYIPMYFSFTSENLLECCALNCIMIKYIVLPGLHCNPVNYIPIHFSFTLGNFNRMLCSALHHD